MKQQGAEHQADEDGKENLFHGVSFHGLRVTKWRIRLWLRTKETGNTMTTIRRLDQTQTWRLTWWPTI
jgi:hypothetical protein